MNDWEYAREEILVGDYVSNFNSHYFFIQINCRVSRSVFMNLSVFVKPLRIIFFVKNFYFYFRKKNYF